MELKVLRFSQEASLTNPKDVKNFLVLGTGRSEEIRVEISTESMRVLVGKLYTGLESEPIEELQEEKPVAVLADPPESEATLFSEEPQTENQLAVDEDGIESL